MAKVILTKEETDYLSKLIKNNIATNKIAETIYNKLNSNNTVKVSYNGIYLTKDDTFTTEIKDAIVPLNHAAISKLIEQGKLYFDFSENAEEEKAECIANGEEWHDSYSYEKVTDIFNEDRNHWTIESGDVDPLCTTLRDIKLVNDITIKIKDDWSCVDDKYRRLTIRI